MPVLLCVCVLCNRQMFATKCAVETHQISMLFLQLVSEALNFPKKSDNLGLKVPSQLSNYCQISKTTNIHFKCEILCEASMCVSNVMTVLGLLWCPFT